MIPSTGSTDMEATARNTVEDASTSCDEQVTNEAMRQVRRMEAYIKIDVDGDGIAEMRKVVVPGQAIPCSPTSPGKARARSRR
jgi:hypothetical protein